METRQFGGTVMRVGVLGFDTLQTSLSIADPEAVDLTLPLARDKGMGVIARRPITNTAWRYADRPENAHHQLPGTASNRSPTSSWGEDVRRDAAVQAGHP